MQNFRYLDLFIQIYCAFASVGNFKNICRPINNNRNNCPTIQSDKHTKHNHSCLPWTENNVNNANECQKWVFMLRYRVKTRTLRRTCWDKLCFYCLSIFVRSKSFSHMLNGNYAQFVAAFRIDPHSCYSRSLARSIYSDFPVSTICSLLSATPVVRYLAHNRFEWFDAPQNKYILCTETA